MVPTREWTANGRAKVGTVAWVSDVSEREQSRHCSKIELNKVLGGPKKDLHVEIERTHHVPEKSLRKAFYN